MQKERAEPVRLDLGRRIWIGGSDLKDPRSNLGHTFQIGRLWMIGGAGGGAGSPGVSSRGGVRPNLAGLPQIRCSGG